MEEREHRLELPYAADVPAMPAVSSATPFHQQMVDMIADLGVVDRRNRHCWSRPVLGGYGHRPRRAS